MPEIIDLTPEAEIVDLTAGDDLLLIYLLGAASLPARRISRATLLHDVVREGEGATLGTVNATALNAESGAINDLTVATRLVMGAALSRILTATASITIPTAAAGAQVSVTLTLTGATTTDIAQIFLPSNLPAGLICRAVVTAANTVTVYAFNASAASIPAASYAARALVLRVG